MPLRVQVDDTTPPQTRYVDFVYQPIFGDNGRTSGIFVQGHDVTTAHELAAEVTYQAHHDTLTGLLNRRGLKQKLATLRGQRHRLLYLDLDHFKIINDRCGHIAGDEMLVQVSERLRMTLGDAALLARIGGDEFVLILENSSDAQAIACAQKLLRCIDELVFFWEGGRYSATLSVGIAAFDEREASYTEALSLADSACFIAKDKGRNRYELAHSDNDVLQRQLRDMDWTHRLKNAMREDRVLLYGQRIQSLQDDCQVNRLEVLSRIRGEGDQLIAPGLFIPAAERFGLIEQLDRHIIAKVFQQMASEAARVATPTHYFVNVSGYTLSNPEFRYFMTAMVDSYPAVNPAHICLEITETAAVANLNMTGQMMAKISGLGISFALDDFGSGVATFNYLENLPIKYVKIDGEFISGLKQRPVGQAIVKSIHDIARVMGVQTIAECIEEPETLDYLTQLGVDYGQGYGIHRPEPLQPT